MKGLIDMRYLKLSVILVVLISVVLPISAQEPTPPAPTADEIKAMLQEARNALDEAERANDLAFNLLGLFEATSGAVGIILGIIVPVIAVIAGLFGFSRLNSAQNELKEAKEKFETDVKTRQAQMDEYFKAFDKNTEELRNTVQKRSANANLALSMLLLADRQYKSQDYQGAIDTYQRALKLDDSNPITHYRLGYVFTQKGDLDDAQQHIEKALQLDPDFEQAVAAMGYVYRRKGDKLDSLANKQEKQGLIAESQKTRQDRDNFYNQSEGYFLRVLPNSPTLIDEDGESWWGALGGLYKRRGLIKEAIDKYERATKATKSSSYPFSNLALLYLMIGDREKMLKTYAEVERLAQGEAYAEVDNFWAHSDLVTSRVAQGKFAEAWAILDTALHIAPADGDYPLELMINTLRDLNRLLPEYDAEIQKIIAHVQAFWDKRKTPAS
jgi:tetratricopeptide (TPR) repeat protein